VTVVDARRQAAVGAMGRRRVVGVIGSGTEADPHSEAVGRLVASLGCDLLTGGGRGVMEAVSRAFFETSPRAGVVIGVVPGEIVPLEAIEQRHPVDVSCRLRPGYPNPWVELAIYTHLPDSGPEGTLRSSRNHINVLSSDVMVALPGGEGTESEIWLAVRYGVPIVAYGNHGEGPPHGIARAGSLDAVRDFLLRHARR
jgi:predicted Rossmann-fold nucleotide-binding protein